VVSQSTAGEATAKVFLSEVSLPPAALHVFHLKNRFGVGAGADLRRRGLTGRETPPGRSVPAAQVSDSLSVSLASADGERVPGVQKRFIEVFLCHEEVRQRIVCICAFRIEFGG
jgi:hypothetical protein